MHFGEEDFVIIKGKDLFALAEFLVQNDRKKQEQGNKPTLMTTAQVKIHLMQKGLHVKSHSSFKQAIKDHGLTAERKGKVDWYKTADVEAIPPAITKN